MNSPIFSLILTIGCGLFSSASSPDPLGPGSPAPALKVDSWYKGTPISSFRKDKLYVVEFWATWCVPCKECMPHLSDLAKKNPDVTFIGLSILEDASDGSVKRFVDQMGTKMAYNVGYGGNQTGMAASWMKASGHDAIPLAFVVKEGRIEWIGHPMNLDRPLEEIKTGEFDEDAFKVRYLEDRKREVEREEAFASLQKIDALYKSGKKADAEAALEPLVKERPFLTTSAGFLRLGWFAKDDLHRCRETIKAFSESKDDDKIRAICQFAIGQTGGMGNKDLGREAIESALKATGRSDFLCLYSAAVFYQKSNDAALALACWKEADEELPKSRFKDNPVWIEHLRQLHEQLTSAAPNR